MYDKDNPDQKILIKSISQVFSQFIKLRMIEASDLLNRNYKGYFNTQTDIVITTSVASLNTMANNKIFQSKTLIGFFNFSQKERHFCNELNLSILDRVVTVNDQSFDFVSKFIARDKVRKTQLALDLRRFYNLKNVNTGSELTKIGLMIEEKNLGESILSGQFFSNLLGNKNDTQIIIQPIDLTEQSYSFLTSYIPEKIRNKFTIVDHKYSTRQQIEFFKSIDLLILHSDSLAQEVLRIEAEAAGILVLEKNNLNVRGTATTGNLISSDIHSNDFRVLKFAYLRNFFADGLERNQPREAVVVPADAGFFSVFNTLVSIRAHWVGVHGFSTIKPDWSVDSVLEFWNTRSLTSYCYASENQGNVFYSLFQNVGKVDEQISEHDNLSNSDSSTSSKFHIHSPNLFADPDFTYVHADRLYRSAGFQNWRNEMNASLNGLKPNDDLVARINELFSKVSMEDLVIGMHVRHPSHAMEQPNSEIPLAGDYIRVAKELLKDRANNYRKIYIFLATDQDTVVEEFRTVFGNQLLVFDGITRVTNQESIKYENLNSSQKLEIGSQVQHIAAKNSQKWNSKLAEEVITDAWALARCQILLHAVSNVATAVTFINPELESFPLRRGDTFSSIKYRKYLASISSVI